MALQIHAMAVEAVRELRPVVEVIERHDRDLGRQLRRAASSVVLNVAEGEHSRGGVQRARLATASGSAAESKAALEVALAWGYVDRAAASRAHGALDRVCAVLWRLTHPR